MSTMGPSDPYGTFGHRTSPEPPPPRMRVLPLPAGAGDGFLLVFDRVPVAKMDAYAKALPDVKTNTGAAGCVAVPDTLDVPQAYDPREVL